MADAKKFAKSKNSKEKIELQAGILSDDQDNLDFASFDHVAHLHRHVSNIADFYIPRPLPLIYDIIKSIDLEDHDVGIYTNSDIALTPQFYAFVRRAVAIGHDALVINRRTVSPVRSDSDDVLSIAAAEIGSPHPGYDCFVFSKRLQETLPEHTSCIGIKTVAVPILFHLVAETQNPALLYDAHLTFHFGNDQAWKNSNFSDYEEHNRREYKRVISDISADNRKHKNLTERFGSIPEGILVTGNVRNFVGARPKNAASVRWLARSAKSRGKQLLKKFKIY